MDPSIIIGIGFSMLMLIAALFMEGGSPIAYIQPTSFMIVIGGTMGVLIASAGPKNVFVGMPKMMIMAMTYKKSAIDKVATIRTIGAMAERARREGLLALEDEADKVDDAFIKKGISLVVDGTDPELVKDILESELDAMAGRHHQWHALFQSAGGFAPTLGVLGTVLGLVVVLQNLSDPSSLGHSISVAFIATLYGVGAANIFYLPIGGKLRAASQEEVHAKTMIIEGIVSIQAGDNPRVVEEKLKTFLAPSERAELDGGAGGGGAGGAEAPAAQAA